MTIQVLVVDDSAVVRQVVQEILGAESGITVIGLARDPLYALELMKQRWPDVIVLDIEMPRMDGITFLKQVMGLRPTPVVICSSLAEAGTAIALEALAAGACSIITKPTLGVRDFLRDSSDDLVEAIRAAAVARISAFALSVRAHAATPKLSADAVLTAPRGAMHRTTDRIVTIGISTGGTQALEYLLPQLPGDTPGMAIVQHMPAAFTSAFAHRLDKLCTIEVKEARSGDRLHAGRALIAQGGKHLVVRRSGAFYYVDVIDGPPVSRHRPSVDVLFRSAATCAGANATGIIMTGMGDDGARGLKEMRDQGAVTYAQDEKSCIVFGMPKEAIKLDAVQEVVPLHKIAERIIACKGGGAR
jgi:two-component system, chemotaxis family, protein-glutamate methylesterase/glutaminase